jgi:hypothetical protein
MTETMNTELGENLSLAGNMASDVGEHLYDIRATLAFVQKAFDDTGYNFEFNDNQRQGVWQILDGLMRTIDSAQRELQEDLADTYQRGWSDGGKAEYKRGYGDGKSAGLDLAIKLADCVGPAKPPYCPETKAEVAGDAQ